MEAFWFMLCSMIETLAIYSLIMSLFRFKTSEYIWQALFVMLFANLQSFILRNELSLAFVAPLITIVIFIFLFTTVIKVPVLWSATCTILGYVLYALIQTVYVMALFESVEEVQTPGIDAYVLQLISGATALLLSWLMYRFGIGFSFDFEKLRFKFEHIVMTVLIVTVLLLVSVVFYYNRIWINIIFFATTFGLFIYYMIRTEESVTNDD
ncbi:hypothetical protein MNQ98_09275 [Paenibacillus sp. N3/727]|uniref:hypothetical protein n=1 Tax=Paenibacillus sp. N3/727 TaxID=2925845 RepID=UPI001F52B695|nr:hypothetical protein [Paenibacillus sp. N3/727]UNK20178.1 hypothetical protein MNQ98_09275 [Paenibacillus sp. N3/727]